MSDVAIVLFEKFCAECGERMQRSLTILEQHNGTVISAESYDKLHQEFDSLVGAARAVNAGELEEFYRVMASMARYLRNKLPIPATKEEESLLRQAVEMATLCNGVEQHCLAKQPEQIETLLDTVKGILENS